MLAVVAGALYLYPLLPVSASVIPGVSLVVEDNPPKPVQHEVGKLTRALEAKGTSVQVADSFSNATSPSVVLVGFGAGNGPTANMISELNLTPPRTAESLLIRKVQRDGRNCLLVAGADAVGLMYGLLDVAARGAPAAKPLTLTAQVSDPAGVKRARVRFRCANQHQDHQTVSMLKNSEKGDHSAVIPAEDIVPDWDLMYFIEVIDREGNGQIIPTLTTQLPISS